MQKNASQHYRGNQHFCSKHRRMAVQVCINNKSKGKKQACTVLRLTCLDYNIDITFILMCQLFQIAYQSPMFYFVVMGSSLPFHAHPQKPNTKSPTKTLKELKLWCPEIFHPLMVANIQIKFKGFTAALSFSYIIYKSPLRVTPI